MNKESLYYIDFEHARVKFNLDIGEWGAHEEAVGTSFLKDAASGEDALAIMRTLGLAIHNVQDSL